MRLHLMNGRWGRWSMVGFGVDSLLIGAAMFLAACGGGSSSTGTAPVASPVVGTIIDSPIAGLHYLAIPSNLTGFTNAQGQYNYRVGDTVTFDIGGRPIGNPVTGAPEITPLSLFNTNDINNQQVVNLSRLLLTLAVDGPPSGSNPIVINSGALPPLPPTLNFDVPPATFTTNIGAGTGTGNGPTLVDPNIATTHLQQNFSTVTVTLAGSGTGTVTSLPGGINCSTTCSFAFTKANSITLQPLGTGFAGWSGTGSATGCTGTGNCTFTPSSDSTITATFNGAPPATLTTSIVGNGSVSCSVNSGAFGPCAGPYANGATIEIRATADSGSTFTGWTAGSGNAATCDNTTSNCSFTITANSSITANFAVNVTLFSVTASTGTGNGGGGIVQCSVNGGAAGACGSYPVGTAVSVVATPNGVSLFSGWSGGSGSSLNANCNSATGPCNFTLTGNTTLTANFNRPVLTVNVAGTGSVNSSPAGITNCTGLNCQASFDKGAVITLTASGTGFSGWSLGSCPGTGTCQVTLTASTAVTATFGSASSSTIFKFIGAPGRELLAVNPASPGTPTPVKVGGTNVTLGNAAVAPGTTLDRSSNGLLIMSASYGGSSTVTNIRHETIVFTSGGRVYKASTLVSNGVPGSTVSNEPQQVSSLALASNNVVCGLGQSYDVVNSNPGFAVVTQGSDNSCNTPDDQVIVMHLNDSTGTAPVTLPAGTGPQGSVYDLTTGAVLQVLLVDAQTGNLSAMDPATAAITSIVNGTGIGGITVLAEQPNKVFLGTSTNVYIYTPSTHTLNATPVVTADPATAFVNLNDGEAADLNNLFMVQSDGAVYKVPLTAAPGTHIAAKHFTAPGGTVVYDARLTPNQVILATGLQPATDINVFSPCFISTPRNCNNGILAVDKVSGSSTVIEAATSEKAVFLSDSFNNYVRYTRNDPATGGFQDGAVLRIEDASSPAALVGQFGGWAGSVLASSVSLISFQSSITQAIYTQFIAVGPPATGTVSVLSSPTGSATLLGTVTAGMGVTGLPGFFRDETQQTASIGIAPLQASPTNNRPFFVDMTLGGSLAPITTPGAPAPWRAVSDE